MLQSNHLPLRSLQKRTSNFRSGSNPTVQRSQVVTTSSQALEALYESLPENLSANKRAMINRLVALYEQGALS